MQSYLSPRGVIGFYQDIKPTLKLMLPILLTQFAQAGYGLIDTIMAGNVSAADLAAVAIGAGIWLPLFLFMLGVIIATTPLLGELLGQNNHAHVPLYTQQSLWLAAGLGMVFSGVLLLAPLTFSLFDVPAHLQKDTALYLLGIALGFPAVATYTSLRCYTESLELPRPVTIISLTGVLLDIPLNYVFIYGKMGLPALGGAGCGFATAVLMWLTVLMLAGYLAVAKAYKNHRFYAGFALPDVSIIKRLLSLGLPIGIAIFFEASLFSVAAVILAPLGEITVAAHQVALSVTSQLFMVPLALALALTIRVSNAFGAKNWARLHAIKRQGYLLATLFAMVSTLLLLLFRKYIVTLYTPNLDVQLIAMQLLLFAAAYQVVDAWQVVSAGILRGVQDTKAPMWITLFAYWVVGLTLGVLLARVFGFGAHGFWAGLVVGLSLAALLLILRMRSISKRKLISRSY